MTRTVAQKLILVYNIEKIEAGADSLGSITVTYSKQVSGVTSLQAMEKILPVIKNLDKNALRRGETFFNLSRAVSKAKKIREWDGMFMFDDFFIFYIDRSVVNFCKIVINEITPGIAGEWSLWLNALWGLERFTQAYLCDSEYSSWQNEKNIARFKQHNKDYSDYKIIPSNAPPPLNSEMIDISKNPGRILEHDRWIEAVASPIWFGDEFWKYMKPGKKEEILASNLVKCKELPSGILEVRALDHCIDETTSPEFQNQLRQLFYDVVPE